MKVFLAKSDGETLVDHTLNLLENSKILYQIYPKIELKANLLELACIYHDLGKINHKFQTKVRQNQSTILGEIPHGLLSTAFIPTKELISRKYSNTEISVLAYSVAYHHERELSGLENENFVNEIEALKQDVMEFPFSRLGLESLTVRKLSSKYFKFKSILRARDDEEKYHLYVMLKGLLNRVDYAASAHSQVEYPPNFLDEKLEELHFQWNSLQEYMRAHQDLNMVAVAQTGMGKTEAGLLWIGNNKGFFTLPLRTAINAIYSRIYSTIVKEKQENRVGLLHADIYQEYTKLKDLEIPVEEYETKTRQWCLPLTVCTIDQIFDFVYRYAGYESKLATLSYSKIVIDEIQMYSADLLAYLLVGLRYIHQYGGKFAILTATLPPFILDLLKRQGIPFAAPEKPFIDAALSIRHAMEVVESAIQIEPILAQYQKNKVLVICNTVKQAKIIFEELSAKLNLGEVHLLHSQFIKQDRAKKEEMIFDFGQKECDESGIWVTTQVVEASLDIDFDILFTELSDLNGLFQRMGRCYRKRLWTEEVGTNVYVFNGGDKACSGVKYVVDKQLFENSKTCLKQQDGPLSEEKKMHLVEETYTTEKMKNTEYYQKVIDNMDYLDLSSEGEESKKNVKKIFRNIHNRTIIPNPVYQEKIDEIERLLIVLKERSKLKQTDDEKKIWQKKRKDARYKISQFTVEIPEYTIKDDSIVQTIEINKYKKIEILNCDYSFDSGITYKKGQKEIESNIF
ncbi:CRISPR-associated helicase Cas3' [Vagococcus entomophilus]|uniref:HD Cas3-type domain-containing protein n=1 Tax=Vagococcus entomophilus TaxID=1160095 RepID=A0A430AKM9_9ENTE|nr:CRISPR-associated helicase Cas3' [Vagococcus entomophilus]RSU08638.1 hypothetical protein CBF30_05270 [Vagococcus entomophilus]